MRDLLSMAKEYVAMFCDRNTSGAIYKKLDAALLN
jgi:hypothetical protein